MEVQENIYIKIRKSLKEELRHMAIPQTGASVIVTNDKNEILLLKKSNGNKWVIPGGVQELGEDFKKVALRELEEETKIKLTEDDLTLIDIVTGESRHKTYPNGDEVYNNSVLFLASNININKIDISALDYQDNGDGNYTLEQESTDYGWFKKENLPDKATIHDYDLLESYFNYLEKIQIHS